MKLGKIERLGHYGGSGMTKYVELKNGKEEEYLNNLWLAIEDLYVDMYVSDLSHKEIRKYILEEVKINMDKIEEDIDDPKSELYVD